VSTVALWVLFIATSVYGHVALKLGTATAEGETEKMYWARVGEDPWTLTAIAAWIGSGLLWVLLLRESKLFETVSVSTLRYVLIVLAAAVFLHESVEKRQLVGMVLIAAGVFLVKGRP
jgi:uncharacterized membrane protein